MLPNGRRLIEAATELDVTIIGDGDLLPEMLEGKIATFKLSDVIVNDLSRNLKLSTIHIYILSRKGIYKHLEGGAAWLN